MKSVTSLVLKKEKKVTAQVCVFYEKRRLKTTLPLQVKLNFLQNNNKTETGIRFSALYQRRRQLPDTSSSGNHGL